jgi:hypothetical protein
MGDIVLAIIIIVIWRVLVRAHRRGLIARLARGPGEVGQAHRHPDAASVGRHSSGDACPRPAVRAIICGSRLLQRARVASMDRDHRGRRRLHVLL